LFTAEKCKALLAEIDSDTDGFITEDEFLAYFAQNYFSKYPAEEINRQIALLLRKTKRVSSHHGSPVSRSRRSTAEPSSAAALGSEQTMYARERPSA
jgi:hypothetical protein